jgi:peptide/nickel transport system substrate-binding protein
MPSGTRLLPAWLRITPAWTCAERHDNGGIVKASKLIISALAVALALTMSACGGPSAVKSGGATQSSSTGWDINLTPRDQLVSGEFVGVIDDPIATWNFFSAEGNLGSLAFMASAISPIYYDFNGSGEAIINNDYLLSADPKVAAGADGKSQLVLTLKLNPKAIWNDGKVIGADDWIATWKAMSGANPKFTPASSDGWDQIASVVAGADQQEVIITFKSTYPDWTNIVSGGPLRAEGAATPEAFNDGWRDYKDAYFTGPFKVTNWDQTSGTVTMAPNDKWWGVKPLLTKITWKKLNIDAQPGAFANQEIDRYEIGANADGYAQAKAAQNSVVREAPAPDFRHFTFNSKAPFLGDVKVRQAIAMGIDRATIAASDMAGLPVQPTAMNNNFFTMAQKGYVDEAAATGIDYNVDKAKALLDEAGWKLNSTTGFREKDGKQLDVTFAVLTGVSSSENEGLQAQKMLKAIGVNLKLSNRNQDDFSKILDEHQFGIVAFRWAGTPYPLANIGQIYGGTTVDGAFKPSDSNYAQLEIAKVLELKPQIDTEMDVAKRLELGNQAAQAVWESVHTLPLYQYPAFVGVRAKLANIGSMGMARYPKWENVGYTK